MKIVVLVIVGGVSSVLEVVYTPLRDVRSKWCVVISNLQSKDADAEGRRKTRSNDTKERDRTIIVVDCCTEGSPEEKDDRLSCQFLL